MSYAEKSKKHYPVLQKTDYIRTYTALIPRKTYELTINVTNKDSLYSKNLYLAIDVKS